MSPDPNDLKNQIKMAEQQKKDAQKHLEEEKKMLKAQMAEHKKEKSKASADLSKLS